MEGLRLIRVLVWLQPIELKALARERQIMKKLVKKNNTGFIAVKIGLQDLFTR